MVQMSTVWDRTTAFASSAIAAIVPIALLLLFLPMSVQLAIAPLLVKQAASVRVVVMAVFWAIELLGTLSLMVLALGATLRAGEAVRAALPRLGPTIATFILFFVVVVIALVPFGIALVASGVDMAALEAGNPPTADHVSIGAGLFVLGYALVLLVVGVWITARLLVIEPVILAERRGLGAITRAFSMTRGLALKIVGVVILYAIVATVAVLAAQTVFGAIFALVVPTDGDISLATVLTSIVVAAVSTAFKVIAAVFVAKLYMAIVEARARTAGPA